MANFRQDSKTKQFVLFPPAREARPHDSKAKACPFCPGQESLNEEIFRVKHSFATDDSGSGSEWLVRVITNKFPLTDYHEVFVHSPDHYKDLGELQLEQVSAVLGAYRERFQYHTRTNHGNVLIFLNHNVNAGASLHHPHSQLVVTPPEVELHTEEREIINNVVFESEHFVACCPDFSQWEYELWLVPKSLGQMTFGEASDLELTDLALDLKRVLHCLDFDMPFSKGGDGPSYNFYIYHGQRWFLRITPRINVEAGFEIGSGIMVNEVEPERAAELYRRVLSP